MATRTEAIAQEWKPKECFAMELKHGLMGYFPLIHKTEKNHEGKPKIVVCAKREDLKKIWEGLPKEEVIVEKILFLINEEGTEIVVANNEEMTSDDLFFMPSLPEDCNIKEEFKYTSGLFRLKEVGEITFPE